MITIYCDESETERPHIFTIAGWAATPSAWNSFNVAWQKMLDEVGPYPASAFHMMNIAPGVGQGEFARWSQDERNALVKRATDILLDPKILAIPYAVAASVVIDDIRAQFGKSFTSDDAYLLCYQMLMLQVVTYPRVQMGLEYVFDRKVSVERRVAKHFADAQKHLNAGKSPDEGYLYRLRYEDDTNVLPLQAADFLAYEVRRFHFARITNNGRTRKSYERLKERPRCFRVYDKRFLAAVEEDRLRTGEPLPVVLVRQMQMAPEE